MAAQESEQVQAIKIAGASESQPIAVKPNPQPLDPNDPAEVQRRFLQTINDDIKRAAPGLKKTVTEQFSDGPHTYSANYTGKFSYDIKKSDSIVSPYLGTVSWSTRWYHNGVEADTGMVFEAHYAYQDGKWVMKDLSRCLSDGKRLPAPEYLRFFQ